MFEEKTTSAIHDEMIEDIPDRYDKTDGSFVFDVTRPPAKQISKAYQQASDVAALLDVENHHDEDLDLYVNQRTGQERRQATHAVGVLDVEGNGRIEIGDLFQTRNAVQFESLENKVINENGTIRIRSVLPGDIGNVPADQITEMPVSLSGINNVNNTSHTSEGYEKESDEELRSRFLERVQTPPTSGNIYHYRNWAKEIEGVGAVRIVPLWNGDNTVKVIIIDSNKQPSSDLLVEKVQEYIDPGGKGLGEGEAPIGAFCTVVSAKPKEIDVNFKVIMEQGYDNQLIVDSVKENVTEYLKDIAFERNFVSYAQIGGLILESDGVIDYSDLTVNDGIENITLTDEEVAVLGGVTIDE